MQDGQPRARRTVVIRNSQGFHARPADLFAKLANQFSAEIHVVKENLRVDGKSILLLFTLAAEQGTELVIEATGADAEDAVRALASLVERDIAEEDTTGEAGKPV